jgi:hypothetical protein
MAYKKRIGGDDECPGLLFHKRRKRIVDVVFAVGVEHTQLQSERVRGLSHGCHSKVSSCKAWVHQHCDQGGFRKQFVQELDALCV